ncbi:MBOAT, membrane-bound O-acyltransferase family-domain-containing protein [Dunaliella salina]|uniref:MBOAT, membrane-bound O-acyltransferase family-domain-containing protein n=1 Tax=Dunaliella salina TaxID=3046 RepID=A0ABQ7FT06_DUNSA|nr:MBOAT, membrane-bound O-acyltransferase family-domain-containing protein [Dunaliella salina]|eukprot:KAF5825594.1 MBOAT, membrane-bound O-acyltransferase family-domain-containing protein [Dunaliella salina]
MSLCTCGWRCGSSALLPCSLWLLGPCLRVAECLGCGLWVLVHFGFWVLVYMWLKFLIIWRFFRAVALADGIVPPENMGRCVCNNYDIEGFWRSWHASYNRWLVRYVYVPLGGNRWVTDARAPDNYFFALPALNWYPLALSRDACCRLSAGMLLECKIMRGCRCFVSLL